MKNIQWAAFQSCDSLTIYGYTGSCAEQYANTKYIPFVSLGEAPVPDTESDIDTDIAPDTDSNTDEPAKPAIHGDLSGDGKVTLKDASIAQKYAVGLITLTADQIALGDMNGNGAVKLIDAYAIRLAVTQAFSE